MPPWCGPSAQRTGSAAPGPPPPRCATRALSSMCAAHPLPLDWRVVTHSSHAGTVHAGGLVATHALSTTLALLAFCAATRVTRLHCTPMHHLRETLTGGFNYILKKNISKTNEYGS